VPAQPEKGPGSAIDRKRYESYCIDILEGMTVREAQERHKMGHAAAIAIRKHLGELVPSSDDIAAGRFEAVRDMALQRIFEKIAGGEGKLGELSVAAGVSADKLDIIRGRSQPSQVHQHLHISHAAVEDILRSMPGPGLEKSVAGPQGSVDVGMSSEKDAEKKRDATSTGARDAQSPATAAKAPRKQTDSEPGAN